MPSFSLADVHRILHENPDLKPKLAVGSITHETRFREDLGFDSLAMAAFFYTLQDIYADLSEENVPKWKRIEDCIQSVKELA